MCVRRRFVLFFFNDTATTEIYTLSLHDALPIYLRRPGSSQSPSRPGVVAQLAWSLVLPGLESVHRSHCRDRKSTRLNSSHANISYAVFCLKKKKKSILQNRSLRMNE